MADISFTARGLDGLVGGLEASGRDATRRVGEAVRQTTDDGVRIGKTNAPVRTGRLQSEIYGTSSTLSGLVVSPTFYAKWVEHGTSRMAPRGYFRRTAAAVEPLFRERVADAGRPDL